MKAYVLYVNAGLSDREHSGGAALVLADHELEAIDLLCADLNVDSVDLVSVVCIGDVKPEKPTEQVLIFPDAGCC